MPVDSSTYQKYYNALQQAYGQDGAVEKGAFNLGYDDFKTKLANQDYAQKIYGALQQAYGQDGAVEKGAFTLPFQDFYSKVQRPQENPLTDIRQLAQQASQPVRRTAISSGLGFGVGTTEIENQEDVARNQQLRDQYDKKVQELSANWGMKAADVGQVLQDFPDEMRPDEIKSHAQVRADNPAMYDRLRDANAIRLEMSKAGPDGIHDANIFNALQQSDDYGHFRQNLEVQKQLIAKHGLGNKYMDLLASTQAPLFNAADPGINQKHYTGPDKDLGLSKYQFAGLEYERAFNPDKAKMDEDILRAESGGEKPGWTGANYELARGMEDVKYNLEMMGRNNTARYLSEKQTNIDKQVGALTDHYNQLIQANPNDYQRLAQEYNDNPLVKESQRLDEAAKDLQYAHTEDEQRFPLNASDKATRLVKDALGSGSVMGDVGKWAGHVAYGSGESADNTLQFIQNAAINILGSEEDKTLNNARNIGAGDLEKLTMYEAEPYTGVKPLLNIPDDVKKNVQSIFADPSLSPDEAQQKALSYVRDNMDRFEVNKDAGQQNLTGKVALFKSADMLGQILGIAAQSYMMGGALGTTSKWQRMASAFTPMFTATQNQLYQENLAQGQSHPLLRSTTDAAIIALAGLINPDIDVVKRAVGVNSQLGKTIAGMDVSTWNAIVSRNRPMVDRFAGALKGFGRQMGMANLQYGLLVPAAQYVAHRGLFGEDGNLTQSIKDNLVQTSLTMAIPSILHGVWGGVKATGVNPLQKMALVEVGLKPEEHIAVIDNQVKQGLLKPRKADEMKRVIKMAGDVLENTEGVKSDGSLMNEKEIADLTYSLIRKKIMEGQLKSAAEPQKPIIENQLRELNKHISDLHTANADKQKTELNQMLSDNLEDIRRKMPVFAKPIEDAIKENRPEEVFQMIADQAQETTKVDGKEVSSRAATEDIFGKPLVEKAIEISKQKTQQHGKETKGDAQAERQVTTTEGVGLPAPSFHQESWARTLDYGDNKGKEENKAAQEQIRNQILNDEPIGNTGERFSQLLGRVIPGIEKVMQDDPHNTTIVTHSSVIKALKVWEEMGRPKLEEITGDNLKEFAQKYVDLKPEPEGKVHTFKGDSGNEIKVVRHGETEDNKLSEFRTDDTQLTDKGVSQAKKAGENLVKETGGNIPKIISSDLPRTLHTSQVIGDVLKEKGTEYPRITNIKFKKDAEAIRSDQGQLPTIGQAPEGGQEVGSHDIQQGAAQPSGMAETQQQTGERISEESKGAGEEKERITGIAQRVQEQLGLRKYEKGEGWSPEEAFAFGKAAIAQGIDPEKAMTDSHYANLDLDQRLAIAQAYNYTLHNEIVRAENDYGIDSQEYKDAVKKQDDYLKLVQPLKTESSRAFTAQKGEISLDTESFTSVKKIIEKKQGFPISEEQSNKIVELTKKNRDLESRVNALETRLKNETDESLKTTKKSGKQSKYIKKSAKNIADAIRKGKASRPDSFSAATPASLVWDAMIEISAKTIEVGGTIAQAIADGIQHMKNSDWYKELTDDKREKAEKDFSQYIENLSIDKRELANVKRMEKELSDLQMGIAKQKGEKREYSDRENKLKEDIFEARKNLGLIKSKQELESPESIEQQKDNLAKKFVDKKGNKFTPNESSDIWDYMKNSYLDKGVNYRDAISLVSNDTGLSFEQVSNAIITPKTKSVSDAMWKYQYDLEKNRQATQRYVDGQGQNAAIKGFKKIVNSFREITVFGHGGIFVGTHAGMTLMDLPRAKYTIKAFFNAYKLAYGSDVYYQKSMTELKSSKNYNLAQRYGLKNNPDIINNDAEIIQPLLGRISESGKRGFNAIKILRQALFDAHYNSLSAEEKADPGSAISIAKLVNNATGASNLNIPDWVNEVTFAGGMEAARWGKLTRSPIIATKTALTALFNPESVTIKDRVFSKVWAKRVGTELATYVSLLTINAAIQNALTDDKNKKVNLLHPNKSDWMKMKIGGTTFDFTSGMLSTLHFAESIVYQSSTGEPVYKGESLPKSFAETWYKYGIGKLSPFYGNVVETATRHDYNGNTLPWSDAKPLHKFNHKLSWSEYISSKAPLPVAEGFKTFYDQANQQGIGKNKLDEILTGLKYGLISGGTGFKAYETKESTQNNIGERGGGGGASGTFR